MTDREPRRAGPFLRRDPGGPRPPFRVIATTIGLPLLAFVAFVLYQWIHPAVDSAPDPARDEPVVARAEIASTAPAPRAAVPAKEEPGSRGDIVLILDDVGYDPAALREAAALGTNLNFAIIPGTPHAESSARLLAERGFEILCHLPMEPEGYPGVSPGEGAILTSMDSEEIRARTRALLESVPHARGINNHMGSAATADPRVMRGVLAAARDAGVFFVDSRTTSKSISEPIARELGVRFAARDVFLDDDASDAAVRTQIERLAEAAESGDVAVAIGHLYPSTLRVLREELPRLEAAGYRFLRASEAVR
ncbi:MAG: divergent polysaccharide deacetylase family protein [Thermoanaerobaculia bacterium]